MGIANGDGQGHGTEGERQIATLRRQASGPIKHRLLAISTNVLTAMTHVTPTLTGGIATMSVTIMERVHVTVDTTPVVRLVIVEENANETGQHVNTVIVTKTSLVTTMEGSV